MTPNRRVIRRMLVADDEPFTIPDDAVVLGCESSAGRIIVYFIAHAPAEGDDEGWTRIRSDSWRLRNDFTVTPAEGDDK